MNSKLGRQHTIISLLIYLLTGVCQFTINVDQLIRFFVPRCSIFFPTSLTLKHLNICSVLLVINCTSLMVSPGGPLRMASCANHYGSKCNFSCATGYRLNGSSTVTCIAVGNRPPGLWDSPMPVCQGGLKLGIWFY